jgi:LEA14-like dessication related protein
MALSRNAKIKIGLGVALIGITAFTMDYFLKNVRKLVGIKFDYLDTEVKKLNLKEISLKMNWLITNPSDFNFTIKNQVYDVFINGVFIQKVGSSAKTVVNGRGKTILPTNIYITTAEAIKLGTNNLAGFITETGRKQTKLKVEGTFDISTPLFTFRKLPFYYEDTIHNIMNY